MRWVQCVVVISQCGAETQSLHGRSMLMDATFIFVFIFVFVFAFAFAFVFAFAFAFVFAFVFVCW